jgi:hypothetical protein
MEAVMEGWFDESILREMTPCDYEAIMVNDDRWRELCRGLTAKANGG